MTRASAKAITVQLLRIGSLFRIVYDPYEQKFAGVHIAEPRFYVAHPVTGQIWHCTREATEEAIKLLKQHIEVHHRSWPIQSWEFDFVP